MAIYHLEGKIVSRSQGRSAVAASAYRAGRQLTDERTGLTHDFSNKAQDVLHAEILLPKGAPAWMQHREALWNHVEVIEKRKDAQLAREFNISLPRELTDAQNIELAKTFVTESFVNKGMVADLALHRGHKAGEDQPHMHVMLSLREISSDGFGKKVRAWNDRQLIHEWREAWADICNRHLALHDHDMRIDHRTLEAQGINLEPQTKIGPKIVQDRMARFAEHQQIAKDNGERLLKNPQIALDAITQQQSTFTHQDLARFVNRHTENSDQFSQVFAKIKASPELVLLGEDQQGRERFSTKTMLALETKMIEQATHHATVLRHRVNDQAKQLALQSRTLTAEQTIAFSQLIDSGDMSCLVGFAGTGKSYLLGSARQAWEQSGYRVIGMTLSGIAAENLEAGSEIQSHTIANRLINWENGRERLTKKDIVVIDEAGMVGSKQMAAIIDEAHRAKAKVVAVGDPEQLQAIQAGAAFRAITERIGFAELTEIRRQKIEWQRQATQQLASGQTDQALALYHDHQHVHEFSNQSSATNAMIDQWQDTRSNEPNKSLLMLAYTRAEVRTLNDKARMMRHHNQELGPDHLIETQRGHRQFSENDRIYFLRNEKSLKVKNGTLGTIEKIDQQTLTVKLDHQDPEKARRVTFHSSDYNELDHGYAATIHKSQGVTVDRSLVLASTYFDRHTSYVALSRHRESADVFFARDQFNDFKALSKQLGRIRQKDISLDYGIEKINQAAAPEKLSLREQITQALSRFKTNDKTSEILTSRELTKNSLAEFKAQFEASHPEQAKALARAILPSKEQSAIEMIEKYQHLEKMVSSFEGNEKWLYQRELSRHVDAMTLDKTLRPYIATHQPEIAKQLEKRGLELSKQQRERELEF